MKRVISLARTAAIRAQYWLRGVSPIAFRTRHARLFFPGCSLTCSDPELVARTYDHIRARHPDIGLWSTCCGMPLSKYASSEAARSALARLERVIDASGITEIITACGNCGAQFEKLRQRYPHLKVTSLYDMLSEEQWPRQTPATEYIVHHPCPARTDPKFRESFRRLAGKAGIAVDQRSCSSHALACCLTNTPRARERARKHGNSSILTYCEHCVQRFQRDLSITHVLRLLFGSSQQLARKVSRCAFANHLKLRRLLRI